MTAEQAAALQHLPAVLDALKALATDLEAARSLMYLFTGQPGVPVNTGLGPSNAPREPQTPASPVNPRPPNNVTPEQQKALDDWRNSPARQKLLEEIKAPAADELPASLTAAERKEEAKLFGKPWGQ